MDTFDELNRFVIENYSDQSPFSSFLPGIAGALGIPMWVFYVNRGQAIASFGVESKDAAILEFQPANKAYQTVAYTGFRTFIKIGSELYEPFSSHPGTYKRDMYLGASELELQEFSPAHQLQVNVLYFNLTDEPFAGLVRQVTIINLSSQPVELAVLDGLPVILPYGVENWVAKEIARTAEAWMGVFNLEQNIPFYRVRSSIGDKVEVEGYEAGHFYTTFIDEQRLPALVDPAVIFGQNTALSCPDGFMAQSLHDLYQQRQITVGKTPCGFFGTERTLSPGGSLTLYAIIGHASHIDVVNSESARFSDPGYIQIKREEAQKLVRRLTDPAAIKTSSPLLDEYTRQTFLDNILRGGWPVLLGMEGKKLFVQHIYSRKHGDLERDYNAFYLAPEFYSQGNGNYRDVNQNRREDVWLNPQIADFNVITFMNLIQADGYNPLVIQGSRFIIPRKNRRRAILKLVDHPAELEPFLRKPFTPGALVKHIMLKKIGLKLSMADFVDRVLSLAEQQFEAAPGEGYWIDHWTYNLDLIEAYIAIYPERKAEVLFGKPAFTFYDNPLIVRPRAQKYILDGNRVRQMNAVTEDSEKAALIASRDEDPHLVHMEQGQGELFRSTLFIKLVCLAVIKFATMDPLGMGIEMEAGKPGWYDALNGLPGLFGSSMPETFELARLLAFLREAIAEGRVTIIFLPSEVVELLRSILSSVDTYRSSSDPNRDHQYWDAVARAREDYRAQTRLGFGDEVQIVSLSEVDKILKRLQGKVQLGINRALDLNNGIPPTYFRYRPVEYKILGNAGNGRKFVQVDRFEVEVLPLFLEGPVHALKLIGDPAEARKLHHMVKASDLFDQELKMYKVCASLLDQPLDIGRARAFPPGWLENESIWLHMEYKYLLALLDAGLVEEFYEDFQQVLIPFLDPVVYGRSPLENSSFIASSVHPDPAIRGRGFVARLSGSTAEYLSILHRMLIGKQPFFMSDDQLCLEFKPLLPGWLFDEQDRVTCTFLGQATVIYHNPQRRDTFGDHAAVPVGFRLTEVTGRQWELTGGSLGAPYAEMIRNGEINTIEIEIR
jgi:hypothetical protein